MLRSCHARLMTLPSRRLHRKPLPKRLSTTDDSPQELAQLVEKNLLDSTTNSSSSSASNNLKAWMESLTTKQRSTLSQRLVQLSRPASSSTVSGEPEVVLEPTYQQLRLVALNNAIPFLGFGFMDNAILIIAGDAIDTSLGVLLGISTMCAAAIGNIVSDVAGIMLGTLIEDCATKLNLPTPDLTTAQRQLRSVRLANQLGCAVGIVIGCVIGMFPLLFIDSNKIQARKREAHLDAIFRDVVSEAGSLVGATRVCLYVKVDRTGEGALPTLSDRGKFLYGKYGVVKDGKQKSPDFVPLGRGIISRAALTGEAWRIDDVESEPDYDAKITPGARTMLCVPVLDGQGKTLGVLQAINKSGKGREDTEKEEEEEDEDRPTWMTSGLYKPRRFTEQDVQLLKALASHIGVSLQRLYEKDGEEEELRLRDTIRIMKEYGLAGLVDKGNPKDDETELSPLQAARRRLRLFPDDD